MAKQVSRPMGKSPIMDERIPEKRAGLLGNLLRRARNQARLGPDKAAEALGITPEELLAFEQKGEIPPPAILQRMGTVYPLDSRYITELAAVQADLPSIEERLLRLEDILGHMLKLLDRQHSSGGDSRLRLLQELEDCLATFRGFDATGERNAGYFSIGHLSDRLLRALQDPDFHARAEVLAEEYEQTATGGPGHKPDSRPPATPDKRSDSGPSVLDNGGK
jgi:transcriptional regulator with XRE-family HTH domain